MVNGTLAQNRWCPGSHHVCHRISSDHPALCVAQEVNLKWFDEPLKVISWHPDVQLEAASLPMLVATTSIYDLEARLQHLGPRSHSRNDTQLFQKNTSFFWEFDEQLQHAEPVFSDPMGRLAHVLLQPHWPLETDDAVHDAWSAPRTAGYDLGLGSENGWCTINLWHFMTMLVQKWWLNAGFRWI